MGTKQKQTSGFEYEGRGLTRVVGVVEVNERG